MVNYVIQEMLGELNGGMRLVYPRIQTYSQIDDEKTIWKMAENCSVPKGQVLAVFSALADTLLQFLAEGHTVRVAGRGTFSISLEFDDGKANVSDDGDDAEVLTEKVFVIVMCV